MDRFQKGPWVLVKSTAVRKTPLMANLLTERFPQHEFEFVAFSEKQISKKRITKVSGLIAELKRLSEDQLALFDQLIRTYKNSPKILVLSPVSYQLLQKRRRKRLESSTLLLSEVPSLDYISQLPRVIEEAEYRVRLREENKRLEEELEAHRKAHRTSFAEEYPIGDTDYNLNMTNDDEDRRRQKSSGRSCLKVSVQKWPQVQRSLGKVGKTEFLSILSRLITQEVRGTDRVLRNRDHEFLIFFENIDRQHLKNCRTRLQSRLGELEVLSQRRKLKLGFGFESVHEVV